MALQSGKGAPFELIELRLCEKFSCLPSDLEKQSWEKMDLFLEIINIENQYKNKNERLANKKK